MKVAVRVDASRAIGTGHVRRCLALAHTLRAQGDEVAFVTRDLGVDSAGMIRGAGFDRILTLPAPDGASSAPDPRVPHSAWAQVTQEQDIEDTLVVLGDWAPDWVLVDSYAFDASWHRSVAAGLSCAIAVIDDLADRPLECSLVIDHTCAPDHCEKYAAVIDAERTKILGGPSFALLGPAYAEADRHAPCDRVRSIGIFMGGVDGDGHSLGALEAIDQAGFSGPVEVVATRAHPKLAVLRDRVLARPNTSLSLDLPDLAGFFARHDLQIGAGGGASFERCCIGVPTVLVVVADNQNSVAPRLAAHGAAAPADGPGVDAIAEAICALMNNPSKRRDLAAKSRALVDGHGAARVAKAMRHG